MLKRSCLKRIAQACELWTLADPSVEQFCIVLRKALRRVLDLPHNCHCYLLPLVTDTLSAFDEICKRSARFIASCVDRGSVLVRSVALYGLTVTRYDSFIGSNALFCCDRYKWSLDDLLRDNINLSNFTFTNTHHNLINILEKEFLNFVMTEIFCQGHKLTTLLLF